LHSECQHRYQVTGIVFNELHSRFPGLLSELEDFDRD